MNKLLTTKSVSLLLATLIAFFNASAQYCEDTESLKIKNNTNTKITIEISSKSLYGKITRKQVVNTRFDIEPYKTANIDVDFKFETGDVTMAYTRKVTVTACNADTTINERFGSLAMAWPSFDQNEKVITIKENYEMTGNVRGSKFNDLWAIDNADVTIQRDINLLNRDLNDYSY